MMPSLCARNEGRHWLRYSAALPMLSLAVLCGCPVAPPVTPGDGNSPTTPADNNSLATASALNFDSSGLTQVTSSVTSDSDIDVYNLGTVSPGDRIVADVQATSGNLDAVAAVFQSNEDLVDFNDDRTPDGSNLNPLIDFVVRGRQDTYYLGIIGYPGGNTTGNYQATIRITRKVGVPPPEGQIVFLDWRGGSNVTVPNVGTFNLPAFNATQVGLASSQTQALKDRIQQIVKDRYSGFNMTVLSSDHDAEPGPAHSTVYFGGESLQAFAISEEIDSYNQNPSDKSIVFVNGFRGAFSHTPSFEEMAQAIGNTVAHEVGHLLGLVHTADCADMMDTTCSNDRILTPQNFSTAPLDGSVFPFGFQPEVDLLTWVLGQVGS